MRTLTSRPPSFVRSGHERCRAAEPCHRLALVPASLRPSAIMVPPRVIPGAVSMEDDLVSKQNHALPALLAGAVISSLLLGARSVGSALRRGPSTAFGRRGRLMAIVMAAQGTKVPAYRAAGGGEVVHQYPATAARIRGTGKRGRAAGRQWVEVLADEGRAWVQAANLTEDIDRAFFAEDRAAWKLLDRFVEALRRRAPLADLVSCHGLWVAHHGAPLHYPPDRVARLWDDGEVLIWKGRNRACPDLRGTFDSAVAAGVVEASDHPHMELDADRPAVPSTVIPVEFTNLHFISIGAGLIGPERLNQTAWLVHFSYEEGKPRIIGLCREG